MNRVIILASKYISMDSEIFLATTNNAAYNYSTARYIDILRKKHNVNVFTSAGNVSFLINEADKIEKSVTERKKVTYQAQALSIPRILLILESKNPNATDTVSKRRD